MSTLLSRFMRLRCAEHGRLPWNGTIVCSACGLKYQTTDGTAERFAPEQCQCGVRLMPAKDGDVEFSARAICAMCFQLPSHVDIQGNDGTIRRFGTGDRVLWRDAFRIGDVLVAARISGMITHDEREPIAVALDVESSEPLRLVLGWIAENPTPIPMPDYVTRAANGGKVFITGDEFMRAIYEGKMWHAATDDEGRAKDTAALAAMPDWWATRHEDLEKARDS